MKWKYGFLVRHMVASMFFPGTQKTGVLAMGTRVKVLQRKSHYAAEVVDGVYTGGQFIAQTWDIDNYWKED